MALKEWREVVIDASPETIMNVLADLEALPSWSAVHKRVEVIDTYPDGNPHHVNMTVEVFGLIDEQVLECHWGRDWMVWDAISSTREAAHHVEWTLEREVDQTKVRFDMTLEPLLPIPAFIINRRSRNIVATALEALRRRITG